MLEAEVKAEAKFLRPRLRPKTKFWPRGQLGLKNLTSLVISRHERRNRKVLRRWLKTGGDGAALMSDRSWFHIGRHKKNWKWQFTDCGKRERQYRKRLT